jgi:hypothetical protein
MRFCISLRGKGLEARVKVWHHAEIDAKIQNISSGSLGLWR